ncbi:MAG: histidine phosphatase family protein [Acidimicrobiales bacterium]
MSSPRVWLVRHGETEWSASGRHTSRTDLPLTRRGEAQAKALAPLLSGRPFTLVETSPRLRALRTAELAGFDALPNDDLVEWDYGDIEGLTTDQVRESYPGWTIWSGPWPGGERPKQVATRARRLVERTLELPDGSAALLFSHGHMLRVLAATWLGRPPEDGRMLVLGTAAVSVLGWEHGTPVVQRWNLPADDEL